MTANKQLRGQVCDCQDNMQLISFECMSEWGGVMRQEDDTAVGFLLLSILSIFQPLCQHQKKYDMNMNGS